MREYLANIVVSLIAEIASLETDIILLTILIVMLVMVVDSLSAFSKSEIKKSGFDKKISAVGIEGSDILPVKTYVSDIQRLAGKPDAVIKENGHLIPVERKPLAKKIHDRYIAQVLVYMRLVEEFEGKKPPYGYLILGPKCKRFKIENTEERQNWLQKHIDEMQGILGGKPAIPTPHPRKCRKCDVRSACSFAATEAELVQLNKNNNSKSVNQ